MRLPRTMAAYLLREVTLYSLLGLFAITTLLVSRNALRHLDELVSAGATADDAITVVACLAAALATYAVPVAFLFGVLLATSRLAADAEILALRSCGVGTHQLIAPVALLGLLFAGFTAVLTFDVEHRAQRRLRLVVQTLAAEGRLLEAGEFRRVGERVLHVKRRLADGRFEGVLISDASDRERPLLIFAEAGELQWDRAHRSLRLLLERGDIHIGAAAVDVAGAAAARPERSRRIEFATFDYALDSDEILGVSLSALRPREMTAAELRAAIARAEAGERLDDLRRQDPVYYQLQLERRAALPFAPLLFALLGVPLGTRRKRGGHSFSALLCAAVAFGYYGLLTLGQRLAIDGEISPAAALWLPNAACALAAALLSWRARRFEGGA